MYYNRRKQQITKTMQLKRVLTKWFKYTTTGLAIYTVLYIFCVAAGCPY